MIKLWIIKENEPLDFTSNEIRKGRYSSLFFSSENIGNDNYYFTSSFDHFKKTNRNLDQINQTSQWNKSKIVLLDSLKYKNHVSIYRLIGNFVQAKSFRRISIEVDIPDIILCSVPTIELAYEVSIFAKKKNIPLIIDVVDLWPEIFKDTLKPLNYYFVIPYIYLLRSKARKIVSNLEGITGITTSYCNWALTYGDLELKQRSVFHLGHRVVEVSKPEKTTFEVIFVGSINRQFDFAIALEAIKVLVDINFTFIGNGDLYSLLRDSSSNYKNLRWTGWLDSEELESELMNASIAIMPYKDLPHFQKNITNKFSEYLAYGLPILTSVSGEMLDLLEQHQCGEFYSSSEELVQHILEYKTNSDKLKQHSENAQILQRKHFDIDKINKEFVDFIEEVHTRYHNR